MTGSENSANANLVLIYQPGLLDVSDFEDIREKANSLAPGVEVFIHEDREPAVELIDRLAARPTMVFSPCALRNFYVKRGSVFAGRPMLKTEQMLRLTKAGMPVPRWTPAVRGMQLDPEVWGEWVVIKPQMNTAGKGVMVRRTRRVNQLSRKFPPVRREVPGHLVQQLVMPGKISRIHIETLFGEVLFAQQFVMNESVNPENWQEMRYLDQHFPMNLNRMRPISTEFKAIERMAERCHGYFDDVALLGLTVLVDESGAYYFVEANPGGNTWNFSSKGFGEKLRQAGVKLEEQYSAFDRAARILISKTQVHAR